MDMKKLNVDLDALAEAMKSVGGEHSLGTTWWLDLETGKIEMLSFETEGDAEDEEEQKEDEFSGERRLRRLIEGSVGRFEQIERIESRDGWQIMRDFIDEVHDPRLQQTMLQALGGKGAFGRFQGVLQGHPEARQRWFEFSEDRERELARDWLRIIGVETTWEPPARKQSASDWKPTVVGVHHMQIVVPADDVETARQFYCQTLGLPQIPAENVPMERGGFWVAVGDLPMHIATEPRIAAGLARGYVAMQVTDLAKWRDRLTKAKAKFVDVPPIAGWTRVVFTDAWGNLVELVQPRRE